MKQIGNSTVLVVPSKSRSRIGIILRVLSWCLEMKILSIKQCVELESTKVTRVTKGIKEISGMVKEFGLERVDALRRSSTVAPIRSMQPWSGTGASGLLPNFLTPWQRSQMSPGWQRLCEPLWWPLCCSPWPCDRACCRIDRGFDPCDVVSLDE